ncbi:MAG: oxamate amidohydrolase [Bradyrhizobium sp.]|jgi:gamma-glutamyltranspeptidase
MLNTPRALRGMVTSPHHLASEAGLRVLREGGNAIEATVAMAASLAVVYPHMTGIGGDGFWLIAFPGEEPIAIDACGGAAAAATPEYYRAKGVDQIPFRGPLAANTVAGTISGWGAALAVSARSGGRLPLSRLLEDAVWHGENGFAVSASQAELTATKLPELQDVFGFSASFVPDGQVPRAADIMKLPALSRTLQRIGDAGTEDFYTGQLARSMAADLGRCGSPVSLADLQAHTAHSPPPLSVRLRQAQVYNLPPPTQGLASLMILGLFDRLDVKEAEGFDHVHGIVEATKRAFIVRDRVIGDPARTGEDLAGHLSHVTLGKLASSIARDRALPWPAAPQAGDTVWLGAIDGNGLAVSFIQSIYFEFGSGCVLPGSGVTWQNRGASFLLSGNGPRALGPGRKPFHTLNPALARFDDGRTMVYGTMGGEGQPQTQAAVFTRYAHFGRSPQAAVTAPRWLLGKTWGEDSVTLKVERNMDAAVVAALRAAGHQVELVPEFTSVMGHAGLIVRRPDGCLEGASDPRSDGAAMGF